MVLLLQCLKIYNIIRKYSSCTRVSQDAYNEIIFEIGRNTPNYLSTPFPRYHRPQGNVSSFQSEKIKKKNQEQNRNIFRLFFSEKTSEREEAHNQAHSERIPGHSKTRRLLTEPEQTSALLSTTLGRAGEEEEEEGRVETRRVAAPHGVRIGPL